MEKEQEKRIEEEIRRCQNDTVQLYCPSCGHIQVGSFDGVNEEKCNKCGHWMDFEDPEEAYERRFRGEDDE